MNEYAIFFYAMCSQAMRLDASEQLRLVSASVAPHVKSDQYKAMIRSLEQAESDLIEDLILNDNSLGDVNAIDKLKGVFGGE